MTIKSIRAELERLKEIARSRPVGCVCKLVHIVEDEARTSEQEAILEANSKCRAHNHDSFSVVEVVPIHLQSRASIVTRHNSYF